MPVARRAPGGSAGENRSRVATCGRHVSHPCLDRVRRSGDGGARDPLRRDDRAFQPAGRPELRPLRAAIATGRTARACRARSLPLLAALPHRCLPLDPRRAARPARFRDRHRSGPLEDGLRRRSLAGSARLVEARALGSLREGPLPRPRRSARPGLPDRAGETGDRADRRRRTVRGDRADARAALADARPRTHPPGVEPLGARTCDRLRPRLAHASRSGTPPRARAPVGDRRERRRRSRPRRGLGPERRGRGTLRHPRTQQPSQIEPERSRRSSRERRARFPADAASPGPPTGPFSSGRYSRWPSCSSCSSRPSRRAIPAPGNRARSRFTPAT